MTSCHVSLNPKSGPVIPHTRMTPTATRKALGCPVMRAAVRANREKRQPGEAPFMNLCHSSMRSDLVPNAQSAVRDHPFENLRRKSSGARNVFPGDLRAVVTIALRKPECPPYGAHTLATPP